MLLSDLVVIITNIAQIFSWKNLSQEKFARICCIICEDSAVHHCVISYHIS